jgi:endoglucanase
MMKTVLFAIAFVSTTNAGRPAVFSGEPDQNQHNNVPLIGKPFEVWADSIAPDSTGMDTLTSVELTARMVPGWNLGNTLEALPNETSWGNPLTTQRLLDSVKGAGFNSVRMPVAWFRSTDTSIYTINPTWLSRVEEVVKYALNTGLYVIINEHWDNGWQIPTSKDSAYVNRRLAAMWEQIAVHFRDYDAHLLFAGTNEIHVPDNWGGPTKENYTVQNSFNQTFVNAVRSTGGRNYYRYLVMQGYVTNIDYTVSYFSAPVDVTPSRLMVEVHYYDPYDFTLNPDDKIIQWGMYATDPSKTETWANESYADGQFKKMKSKFVDKGFGVILGEYGATIRTNLGSPELNAEYENYRRYYTQYITRSMERQSLVPYYWDVGYYGNHGSGIFDRTTGAHVYPDILKAIIDTSKVDPVVGVGESPSRPTKFFLGQNYPNPFNPATTIGYQIPTVSGVTLKVYDMLGREVRTLVNDMKNAGNYEVKFDATDLPTGVYFYRLQASTSTETKKLTVLK